MTRIGPMSKWNELSIRKQIAWTRRVLPVTIFVIVISVQSWLDLTRESHDLLVHMGLEILIYALVGPLVTWFVLLWIERQLREKESVENRLRLQEQRLLQIRDEVSARIASDLHDRLGPNLFALALKADLCRKLLPREPDQVARELEVMHSALQESLREARRAVYALRPIELERHGLWRALRKLASDFEELDEIKTELVITGNQPTLAQEIESALFHVAQEALYNIRRHAGAGRAQVKLDIGERLLCLRVRDDGRGFDIDAIPEGMGRRHMRERAEALGGTLTVESEPGRGTEVAFCIPLQGGGVA